MKHTGSLFSGTKAEIEAAEARGELRGYAAGWSDRGKADVEFCDRHGHGAAANDLRSARIVDRDTGKEVEMGNG